MFELQFYIICLHDYIFTININNQSNIMHSLKISLAGHDSLGQSIQEET